MTESINPEVIIVAEKTSNSPKRRMKFVTQEEMDNIKVEIKEKSIPIDQTWLLNDIVTRRTPVSWEKVFDDAKFELEELSLLLEKIEITKGPFYPLKSEIFRCFELTKLQDIKVVILGQDPYTGQMHNGLPMATGLSFSCRREDEIAGSLKNIFNQLVTTIPGYQKPSHGDLTQWTSRGVLLLNTCLTVTRGIPKSHGKIWLGFIVKVLKEISKSNPNCIFLLWGAEAIAFGQYIDKGISICSSHPSGNSAFRKYKDFPAFNKSDCFVKCNRELIKQGKEHIDWSISG
jgi:uracil-DNA glycosylase